MISKLQATHKGTRPNTIKPQLTYLSKVCLTTFLSLSLPPSAHPPSPSYRIIIVAIDVAVIDYDKSVHSIHLLWIYKLVYLGAVLGE